MYIGSFFKSLFKVRNIPSTIFFLLNTVLIYFLFVFFNLFQFGTSADPYINGAVGIGINFICMFFAMTPFGEAIVRFKMGAKLVVNVEDNAEILDIFNTVYEKAAATSSKISKKIKLYYVTDGDVNAYALGHRTVIVTQGLLSLHRDQIEGILAHEFGHLSNCDSDISLAVCVCNSVLIAIMLVFRVIVLLVSLVFSISSKTAWIGIVFNFIFNIMLIYLFNLWTKLGMLLMNMSSRKCEYAADKYAVDCGYGNELHGALSTIDPCQTKSSALAILSSTHPDTVDRLANIKLALGTNFTVKDVSTEDEICDQPFENM